METAARRRSRVPAGRLERLGTMGWTAGELVAGGIAEYARGRFGGRSSAFPDALLNEWNAERLTRRLATMRGAAMKLGQLLSLEGDDLLPPEFADVLAALRADGDAMPEDQLERVLVEDWGPGWRQRVAEFDPEPIAAASIGQVHRAVGLDGSELALKIQFPGVARSIDSDVDNLVRLARWSRLLPGDVDLDELQREAKRQLRQESDYEAEAEHLTRYGELLRSETGTVIPSVHASLTTRRILAMDYLPGVPLEDLCGPDHDAERRNRVAGDLYRLLLRELFELRFVQSDPNFANFLWLADTERLGLIDLGGAHRVARSVALGYRRMLEAVLDGRRDRLEEVAVELGYVPRDERPDRIAAVVSLIELGWEPFAHEGPYDFGASDLAPRLRDAGLHLALDLGYRRPPPAHTLFIHRKLAGTFLLCSRLRARIDLGAMTRGLLDDLPAEEDPAY